MGELLSIILAIAFGGLIVYVVTEFIPMPPQFKKAIYIVAVVALVIFLGRELGMLRELPPHLQK